jgi:MerR family redox-sensitive transcriptional activator SoxR
MGVTIGQVAKAAGLRASAIRYYEDAGLLPTPRRVGGRRYYDDRVLERLALLEFGKQCGFRLMEVRGLMHGFAEDVPLGRRMQEMAQQKLAELDREEKLIAARRGRIERALACRCNDFGECSRRILARGKS